VLARRGATLRRRWLWLRWPCGQFVGLEFLPKLEEGNIWMRAALPPSVSLDEGNATSIACAG
jgi:Cu/Ag efflux pump CusA